MIFILFKGFYRCIVTHRAPLLYTVLCGLLFNITGRLFIPLEYKYPSDRYNNTDKFSPLKTDFKSAEQTEKFYKIRHKKLRSNYYHHRLCGAEPRHTSDDGVGYQSADNTAQQHILVVDFKKRTDGAFTPRKKPRRKTK